MLIQVPERKFWADLHAAIAYVEIGHLCYQAIRRDFGPGIVHLHKEGTGSYHVRAPHWTNNTNEPLTCAVGARWD